MSDNSTPGGNWYHGLDDDTESDSDITQRRPQVGPGGTGAAPPTIPVPSPAPQPAPPAFPMSPPPAPTPTAPPAMAPPPMAGGSFPPPGGPPATNPYGPAPTGPAGAFAPAYPPPPAPYGQPFAQPYAPASGSNGVAVAALVLGLLVFCFGLLTGIPALICGIIGLKQANEMGGTGKGMAITGIVLGGLSILAIIAWIMLLAAA